MKKINIVKKNEDYNRIIKTGKAYRYKDYVVYIENTSDNIYHFGLSVGKKIGNAVTRNKYKRRIKNILDKITFKNNFNCIIIVKKGILTKTFQEMEEDIRQLVKCMNIIKEDINEEKDI